MRKGTGGSRNADGAHGWHGDARERRVLGDYIHVCLGQPQARCGQCGGQAKEAIILRVVSRADEDHGRGPLRERRWPELTCDQETRSAAGGRRLHGAGEKPPIGGVVEDCRFAGLRCCSYGNARVIRWATEFRRYHRFLAKLFIWYLSRADSLSQSAHPFDGLRTFCRHFLCGSERCFC